jgi:class 3 adenylate cyclase
MRKDTPFVLTILLFYESSFGDTVNTASRMESTGVTNKIQVSQATADLLIAAGLEVWLTPREDLVFAKGKGELQT